MLGAKQKSIRVAGNSAFSLHRTFDDGWYDQPVRDVACFDGQWSSTRQGENMSNSQAGLWGAGDTYERDGGVGASLLFLSIGSMLHQVRIGLI